MSCPGFSAPITQGGFSSAQVVFQNLNIAICVPNNFADDSHEAFTKFSCACHARIPRSSSSASGTNTKVQHLRPNLNLSEFLPSCCFCLITICIRPHAKSVLKKLGADEGKCCPKCQTLHGVLRWGGWMSNGVSEGRTCPFGWSLGFEPGFRWHCEFRPDPTCWLSNFGRSF